LRLSSFVADYVADLSGHDPGFVSEIDPADEMFAYGLHSLHGSADAAAILYFATGRSIADAVGAALAWRFGSSGPESLLDFAAGFGRATRFLVRRHSGARVSVSEVDPAALAFQERTFRVSGIPSTGDPDGFRPESPFDAICASSFFSHLPEATFEPWLSRLWSFVRPGGLLVFSTHGPSLHPDPADWSRGIVFRAESETRRLDSGAYGTSWVLPDFVASAVRRACGADGTCHAVPFGLGGHQDLYVVARGPGQPASEPAIPLAPRGELERFALRGRESLTCDGYVEAAAGVEVVFLVRAEERGVLRPDIRNGRGTWSFEISIADASPDDVLRVEARAADGPTRILAM
jgi:SAM-dependent methyltransferase